MHGEEGVLMNAQALFKYCVLCILSFTTVTHGIITTLSKNDPVPSYTADNPFALLGTRRYEYLKGRDTSDPNDKHMSLEIMPFYQRANRGANICGCRTELGDIGGRWNMIALLPFNVPTPTAGTEHFTNTNEDLPCGQVQIQELVAIRDQLLWELQQEAVSGTTLLPDNLQSIQGLLDLQQSSTTLKENFGFFSVPMSYKKTGIRFNAQFYLGKGFGADMQIGFASISQCATFTNRTIHCQGGYNNPFNTQTDGSPVYVTTATWNEMCKTVSRVLMANLDEILSSTQLCQNCCPFNEQSIEDLNGELFWRYPVEINKNISSSRYPKLLFIPFLAVGGTYAIAKNRCQCDLLGLSFGNNGHSALRVRGGFSFDFYETLQLNFEAGGTIFKSRTYCDYPVPTNYFQHPIYPFRTNIRYCPGNNWHTVVGMYAHNFFDNWSFVFDYIYVNHDDDHIRLCGNNYAAGAAGSETTCRNDIHPFKSDALECNSSWSAQVFNTSLSYSISPDLTLAFFMQIPVKRKNAYRSTTYMGSFYMSF